MMQLPLSGARVGFRSRHRFHLRLDPDPAERYRHRTLPAEDAEGMARMIERLPHKGLDPSPGAGMNAAEAAWREFVSGKLAALTPQLTPVLERLVRHRYPPQVDTIHFEIFSDGFSECFPVRAFFMDEENNEFFLYERGKPRYPSPVDPGLLEIDQVYAFEEEEAFEDEPGEPDLWAMASDELIGWFGTCWVAAGGEQLPIGATIGVHDDPDTTVELPTGRVQQ